MKNLAKNTFINVKSIENIKIAEHLTISFLQKTQLTQTWIRQTIDRVLRVKIIFIVTLKLSLLAYFKVFLTYAKRF